MTEFINEVVSGPVLDVRGLGVQPERKGPEVHVTGAPSIPDVIIETPTAARQVGGRPAEHGGERK